MTDSSSYDVDFEARPPERLLILRLGSMGDVLHALPAVAYLRRLAPATEIDWVIEERWHELLSSRGPDTIRENVAASAIPPLSPEQPLVNRIHLVDTKAWRSRPLSARSWKQALKVSRSMRRAHYEAAVDFQGAWKSAILSVASGAKQRAGYSKPRERGVDWLYSLPVDIGYDPLRSSGPLAKTPNLLAAPAHIIGRNAMLLMLSVIPEDLLESDDRDLIMPDLSAPPLPMDIKQEEWARRQLRQDGLPEGQFAIVNPGTGWKAKCWPTERYGEVARWLARMGFRCLVNYGPGEEDAAQDVVAASGGSAVARQYGIGQLIAITRRARLFVGGDTGPMHLAAALRVPVVAIFGPTDPARNGPYGTAAEVLRSPESVTNHSRRAEPDSAMLSITPPEVLAAARSLLDRTATSQEAHRG